MADERTEKEELPDFDASFKNIVKHEKPKTHHQCECRDCSPLTAMGERGDAFKMAKALLFDTGIGWAEDDVPAVREVMVLADWLLYGPGDGEG